eukprot:scaffold248700_cov21-Tisochrysis_lutea.AAC.1
MDSRRVTSSKKSKGENTWREVRTNKRRPGKKESMMRRWGMLWEEEVRRKSRRQQGRGMVRRRETKEQQKRAQVVRKQRGSRGSVLLAPTAAGDIRH